MSHFVPSYADSEQKISAFSVIMVTFSHFNTTLCYTVEKTSSFYIKKIQLYEISRPGVSHLYLSLSSS